MTGLKAAAKETLREDDRIQLWEFSDVPRKVGSARGHQFMALVRKLTAPDGGTEIGYALGAAARDSEARDFLLITDGKSYALDVQALARTGKRFHVVLVGEDSLEANVGHLAALTAGQIFVTSGAEAGSTIQTALAQMRSVEAPSPPQPDKLVTLRGGMRIEVADSAAAPSADNDPDARLIGGFAAALQLPGMAEAEAAEFAAANGIACHLTSLVLVDEAGETHNCLPSTRKVPLSTPCMAPAAFLLDRRRTDRCSNVVGCLAAHPSRFTQAILREMGGTGALAVVAIAVIGSEQRLAMAAVALSRGISLPDSKNGAGLAESSSVEAVKNRRARQANKTDPNKLKKSFCVKFRRK